MQASQRPPLESTAPASKEQVATSTAFAPGYLLRSLSREDDPKTKTKAKTKTKTKTKTKAKTKTANSAQAKPYADQDSALQLRRCPSMTADIATKPNCDFSVTKQAIDVLQDFIATSVDKDQVKPLATPSKGCNEGADCKMPEPKSKTKSKTETKIKTKTKAKTKNSAQAKPYADQDSALQLRRCPSMTADIATKPNCDFSVTKQAIDVLQDFIATSVDKDRVKPLVTLSERRKTKNQVQHFAAAFA